jgi:hypothetical protein
VCGRESKRGINWRMVGKLLEVDERNRYIYLGGTSQSGFPSLYYWDMLNPDVSERNTLKRTLAKRVCCFSWIGPLSIIRRVYTSLERFMTSNLRLPTKRFKMQHAQMRSRIAPTERPFVLQRYFLQLFSSLF